MKNHPRFDMTVRLYRRGLEQFRLPTNINLPDCVDRGLYRGAIRGFSAHSALRLRRLLLHCRLDKPCLMYGVTLTLPWRSISLGAALVAYRAAFNRFSMSFKFKFPNSAMVFRHELQVRKMPHCHIVLYASRDDFSSYDNVHYITSEFGRLWLLALKSQMYGGSLVGFARYGVKVDKSIGDSAAAYRYLCDHTSKHKVSQLGYQGKQWGVINRKLLVDDDFEELKFPSLTLRNAYFRHITKYLRPVIADDRCPFSYRRGKSCYVRSVQFLSGKVAKRLYSRMVAHPEYFDAHTPDGLMAFHLVLKSMV